MSDKVSSETWLGCGVSYHDDDCLCDVIITSVAPITVRDCVNDMYMGREICDIRGYCLPWTDEKILDYFTDLVRGHDAWVDSGMRDIDYTTNDDTGSAQSNTMVKWKHIRQVVRQALSGTNPKPPIELVLQALNIPAEQFVFAVTAGKFTMNLETLNRFETRVLAGIESLTGVAREFGTTYEIVGNLYKYWNISLSPKHRNTKAKQVQRVRMDELILQGHMPATISKILLEEYDYVIDRHTVSKRKSRLLAKMSTQNLFTGAILDTEQRGQDEN